MKYLLDLVRGFLMGSADVVPGVSGGTVALVLGIYERLVASIHRAAAALGNLVRGRPAAAQRRFGEVEWSLVAPLLIGIALAILTLAAVVDHLLEDQPVNTAAAFFGLVAGSIVIAWRLVRRWRPIHLVVGSGVALLAFTVLGLRGDPVVDPALPIFFGAGAIAIVAMILPGISGSFILLMLGMYQAILDAVNDRQIVVALVFLAGAVIGLAAFSTLLDRLLRDHHDVVMTALIGLMIGSLRVLWPWPDGTATARLAAPVDPAIPVLLALTGFLVVVGIGWLAHRGRRLALDGRPEAETR